MVTAHGLHDLNEKTHISTFRTKSGVHWPTELLPQDFTTCQVFAAQFDTPKYKLPAVSDSGSSAAMSAGRLDYELDDKLKDILRTGDAKQNIQLTADPSACQMFSAIHHVTDAA